ncbi:hypothetical protein ALC56_13088, partial [Trachymyrmex septentrionalis]
TEKRCEKVRNAQQICANMMRILEKKISNLIKNIKCDYCIIYISSFEKATTYNENLLFNVTKKMEMQLQVLTAIMTDLTVDVAKTLDYLAYSKEGSVPTRLLPLEQIITDLREAASQLTKGLQFLFNVKYVNTFYFNSYIFTTLKFPIIAYPTYKIIRAIPPPSYLHSNIFTFVKINHPLIALDKENNITTYICAQTFSIYYMKSDAPCEVLIFINAPGQLQNCENRYVLSSIILWNTLTEATTWLYSTKGSKKISIVCNNFESEIEIKETDKIKLNGDCTLSTPDLTLRTQSQNMQYIKAYLPEYNLTYNPEKDIKIDFSKRTPHTQLIKDPKN